VTRLRAQDGMTIVELLVAMTLSLVVFAATMQVYDVALRTSSRTDKTVNAAERGQQALNRLVRTLREATAWQPTRAGGSASSVLLRAQPADLAIARVEPRGTPTAGNLRALESVRFCVSDGRLYQQRVAGRVTPAAACPDPAWTVVAVIPGIRNPAEEPVFAYGTDASGIASVAVQLDVDDDPLRSPPAQTLRGGVQLRNQNQSPTAAFTVIATAGRHLQLNASTSSDPEGQLLEYGWRDNGVPVQGRSTPILDYVAPAAGTRTIELTVEDPSGGQATVAHDVEVLP